MSLKMATLFLDASFETLRPLCGRCMLHLQGDLCYCLHKVSPQALQPVVMLSAHYLLQKTQSLLSSVLKSALPENQFLALIKARRFLRSHS